jgi:predicted amidophosphoribosyltransferase
MRTLKDDVPVLDGKRTRLMSEMICDAIKNDVSNLPFANFFAANPILVPTPRSSLMKPSSLWVPKRLAHALVNKGLGKSVEECLKRVTPLRKAAISMASDRPKAVEHYHSFQVQKVFPEPKEILLIDDVVTRGATLVGAANKLADAFPNTHIRAFAAMRTMSSNFKQTYEPQIGFISLNGSETFRMP